MRTNYILLSGAAALALLGGASMTPVYAQYAGNPPQYSTPAEQAETQQLNRQNVNGTYQSPDELNGETNPQYNPQNYPSTNSPTYGTYGGYGAENGYNSNSYNGTYNNAPNENGYGSYQQNGASPSVNREGNYSGYPDNDSGASYNNSGYSNYYSRSYSGQGEYGQEYEPGQQGQYPQGQYEQYQQNAPRNGYQQQQYDQQMQQYQDQQRTYQNERDEYDHQRDRYEHNIRWYDQARWDYVYPQAIAYHFGGPRLLRVDMLAEPSEQLADVPIEGPNGRWVGRIRNIETGTSGRPYRIEVALNRRVSVWVSPRHFRFDPRDRIAFTNLTREDLWDRPGATVESYPM